METIMQHVEALMSALVLLLLLAGVGALLMATGRAARETLGGAGLVVVATGRAVREVLAGVASVVVAMRGQPKEHRAGGQWVRMVDKVRVPLRRRKRKRHWPSLAARVRFKARNVVKQAMQDAKTVWQAGVHGVDRRVLTPGGVAWQTTTDALGDIEAALWDAGIPFRVDTTEDGRAWVVVPAEAASAVVETLEQDGWDLDEPTPAPWWDVLDAEPVDAGVVDVAEDVNTEDVNTEGVKMLTDWQSEVMQ